MDETHASPHRLVERDILVWNRVMAGVVVPQWHSDLNCMFIDSADRRNLADAVEYSGSAPISRLGRPDNRMRLRGGETVVAIFEADSEVDSQDRDRSRRFAIAVPGS